MSDDFKLNDLFEENKELSEILDAMVEDGNRRAKLLKFDESIEIYTKAWDILPAPKDKWDLYSGWISGSMSSAYLSKNDLKKSKEWALIQFRARSSAISTAEIINLGVVCFELGQKNEAMEWFDKAYAIGKDRAFKEFDKKYINEYKVHLKKFIKN